MSLYQSIEKTFFHSLTRKICGNVLFLVLPSLILIGLGYWQYASLQALQPALAETPEASRQLASLAQTTGMLLGVMLVLTLAVAGFALFFMRHLFLSPINSMIRVLSAVKDKDGDISATLPVQTNDEIARMAESYNDFSASLKQMIADTRQRSVRVSLSASQLQQVVLAAKASAEMQMSKAQEVFQASQESTLAIEGIAGSTQQISDRNNRNLAEIMESSVELTRVSEQITTVQAQVEAFRQVVEQLAENSSSIISILSLVQGLEQF